MNTEDNNFILEGDTATLGESGSVEAAEQELGMIMNQDTLDEVSQLQAGNQECVKDPLIVKQYQTEGLFGVDKVNAGTKCEGPLESADNAIKEENNVLSYSQEKFIPSGKINELAKLPQNKARKEKINSTSAHHEFIPVAMEHPNSKEIVLSRKCKYCDQVMLGVNPTNLKLHLQRFHLAVFKKVKGKFLLTINKKVKEKYNLDTKLLFQFRTRQRGHPDSVL